MQKRIICLGAVLCLAALFTAPARGQAASPRQTIDFDDGWRFALGDPQGAEAPGFDDSSWRALDVPHDWSIEGAFDENAPTGGQGGYLPTGVGWYRKTFTLPPGAAGKRVWIEFDGVYENSSVYVNGQFVGKRPYGYIGFYYDISSNLIAGDNNIAVRVDNSNQPNSRWYSGSGIYRHVRLVVLELIHLEHWGVSITTPEATSATATVKVATYVANQDSAPAETGKVRSTILGPDGAEIATLETGFDAIEPRQPAQTDQEIKVANPKLWTVESPALYTLRSELINDGKVQDRVDTPFGIRSIEYDTDRGFLLNGERVKMNGVCLHHDGGAVGAAVPIRVWERRLEMLKAMGCNAIRTAHNPPAPEFLDLCDRMGFLVMNEAFDAWRISKAEHDYAKHFAEWAQTDLADFIDRDRNHPSVVMWSIGNEVRDQSAAGGAATAKLLGDIVRKSDPTRPFTQGNDQIAADGNHTSLEFLEALDIVGYNYADRWHERRELMFGVDRHDHPDWLMVGTESGSVGGARGEYSLGDDPAVPRANYLSNMIRAEQLWKFVATHDYVIGDFMWTGIEYLGESRWPRKHATSGPIDIAGFPKDGFYFYQSQWTERPMVHVFPHWNWAGREGLAVPVVVYSNCDAVELFLNDKSLGEKRLEFPRQGTSGGWNSYAEPVINATTADLHLTWDVPYAPGILKAVGKKAVRPAQGRRGGPRGGGGAAFETAATDEVRTAGPAAKIELKADRAAIKAGGDDVAHLELRITDANGIVAPLADNLIRFTVEGAGKLLAVDNANPADHGSYQIPQRNAYNGLALAVVQSAKAPGTINIKAEAEGLAPAQASIAVE